MMKTKYLFGILLATGLGFTACNDDDINVSVNETPIVQTITTDEAQVSAYSAVITGTVKGLENTASSFYKVGAIVSTSPDPAENGIMYQGSYNAGTITADVEGLENNKTYYAATYVTLKNAVTYYGEPKQFVTTAATVGAPSTQGVTGAKAMVSASVAGIAGVPVEVIAGVKVIDGTKTRADEDAKKGLEYIGSLDGNTINVTVGGLLPNTIYQYVPYIQMGEGKVYGETASFQTGDYKPEYVDLGLSVLWASANLGADSPEETGARVGYGSLDPLYTSTDTSDYEEGDIYNNEKKDIVRNLGWGRLPKSDDFRELILGTTQEETVVNGVSGVKFTAPNGNSIFLPYTGSRFGTTVSSEGVEGFYAVGQAVIYADEGGNQISTEYAKGFSVSAGSGGTTNFGRSVAVSVRPVQKIVKEFNPNMLVDTWAIDLDANGNSYRFAGPVYYVGTDDSWESIANEDAIAGDSWSWDADYPGNTWICEAKDYGSMTFNADGTYSVVDLHRGTEQTGTYTVDSTNKTVTINKANVLCVSGDYTLTGTFRILDMTDETLRLGVIRSDGSQCSINYIKGEIADAYHKGENTKYYTWDASKINFYNESAHARISFNNPWGDPADNSIDCHKISWNDNFNVTFRIKGLPSGFDGQACLSLNKEDWSVVQWETNYTAHVTGDGLYTVSYSDQPFGENDLMMFAVEISNLDADTPGVEVEVINIASDVNGTQWSWNPDNITFGNDGDYARISFNNPWGDPANDAIDCNPINWKTTFAVTFQVTDTPSGYSGQACLSLNKNDWSVVQWGTNFTADLSGDGIYTVIYNDQAFNVGDLMMFAVEISNLDAECGAQVKVMDVRTW